VGNNKMNFELLIESIQQTHVVLQQSAVRAINIHLTVRNWLIGYYIVEYEQNGEDRAAYGEKLLQNLSDKLNSESLSYRNLKLFRQFYQTYPQIGQTLSDFFSRFLQKDIITTIPLIGQTLSAQLSS
jgi:hypothetical protein